MKTLVFTIPLKPGKLADYKAFAAEITGPRRKEYTALLKRYGLKSGKVWHQQFGTKEYIIVYHEVEDDARERLKLWSSSMHPFDVWFREQLDKCYAAAMEEAHLIFEFDPQT
jgi:Family of unknown function (DUF6176)